MLALATSPVPRAHAQEAKPSARDLARARTLDQQGARAYAEGRYGDAIRYFEEAYRLGAPPIELWNIAKCYDKVDQPEQAAMALERYLAVKELPKSDREEAQQMLDAIKKRSSSLTVTSSPDGASVVLDGKAMPGRTPLTSTIAPGRHDVTITLKGHTPYTSTFEAKFGRAVIVDAPLRSGDAATTSAASGSTSGTGASAPPATPAPSARPAGKRAGAATSPGADAGTTEGPDTRPLALRGVIGLQVARYGDVGGSPAPAIAALGTYRIGTAGSARIGLGAMMHVTFDSWRNSTNQQEVVPPCGQLSSQNDGVAISAYGVASASWLLHPEVSAGAIAGLGLAGYSAGQLGGDLFKPTCSAHTGILPAVVAGAEVDWRLTPGFRLALFPLLLHLQPAFDGTRVTPRDATGVWLRATIGIGGGFDL